VNQILNRYMIIFKTRKYIIGVKVGQRNSKSSLIKIQDFDPWSGRGDVLTPAFRPEVFVKGELGFSPSQVSMMVPSGAEAQVNAHGIAPGLKPRGFAIRERVLGCGFRFRG
jgi:hypothetical protein